MKLYYAPGGCSLSPHIIACEAGITLDLVKVNLAEHKTEDGRDYYAINPKGYIPALELDNGQVLTEGGAIAQYLADLDPKKKLAPKPDSFERYRLQEWLIFVGTELHKTFGMLYRGDLTDDMKKAVIEKITKRLAYVDQALEGKDYLMGDDFTAADAYCFVITRWKDRFGVSIENLPNLMAFMERVGERPAVKEAMRREGLI